MSQIRLLSALMHPSAGPQKIPQSWRVPVGISALADRTGSKNTGRINQNENKTSTSSKPMQTKQSVTNSNNHQPSTACRKKHAAMKLPIRSTVIAVFGLLSTLLPVSQTAHAQRIPQREFVAPVVFQAAGPNAASIQSTVDAFRAVPGLEVNNGVNPPPVPLTS